MNKNGLLGKLLLLAVILIVIMGATIYLSVSDTGISLKAGHVTLSVDYTANNETKLNDTEINKSFNSSNGMIVEVDESGNVVEDVVDKIDEKEDIGDLVDSSLNKTDNNDTLINKNVP